MTDHQPPPAEICLELERLAECEGGVRGGSERAAETMRQAARALRHSVEREAGLERAVEIAIASMERDECAPCHRIALNTCSNALSPTPPSTGAEK